MGETQSSRTMQGNWDNARDGSFETQRMESPMTSGQGGLGFMEEVIFELVPQEWIGVHQRRKARAPFISQPHGKVERMWPFSLNRWFSWSWMEKSLAYSHVSQGGSGHRIQGFLPCTHSPFLCSMAAFLMKTELCSLPPTLSQTFKQSVP